MDAEKNNPAEAEADREIKLSRVFDAPRELVWAAMTEPDQVVKWWGPRGFTTTIKEMDVRPGGHWKHVMRGPDGTEYPNSSVFTEVVRPERLCFSHGGKKEGGPNARFEATWTFEEREAGKTTVTMRMVFPTAEDRDNVVREYGAIEGGKQTLERLGEELAKIEPVADRLFVISRTFDAPRELVWKAWTNPAQLTLWWGPKEFTNPVCEVDARVGGAYRIVMRAPDDGAEFPLEGVFREVAEEERLVMTMDCSGHPEEWHDLVNPNRDKTKKPALELIQTVTFEKLDDKTKVTIRSRFESREIRDGMVKAGMNEGWSQSLDRLAACVQKMG